MHAAYLAVEQVLGGTSALNFMTWDRATSVEYDAWEKLGNKGWVSQLSQDKKKKVIECSHAISRTGNPCTLI